MEPHFHAFPTSTVQIAKEMRDEMVANVTIFPTSICTCVNLQKGKGYYTKISHKCSMLLQDYYGVVTVVMLSHLIRFRQI